MFLLFPFLLCLLRCMSRSGLYGRADLDDDLQCALRSS